MPRRLPFRAALLALTTALVALVATSSSAAGTPQRPATAAHRTTVTLITGDVVNVVVDRSGRRAVTLAAGPDGTTPDAAITEANGHLYVTPASAMPLVAAHKLDPRLFDVTGLIRQGYDDAHRATVPVIVDYGSGLPAAARATASALPHARKTTTIAGLGMTAYAADKRGARGFWRALQAAAPAHVYLDGRVKALTDPWVEQIHAPQAWAAGYDGTGTTVAVLDTGYDPTHPDLKGVVTSTANFSTNPTVTDGNGHGTHVASTIAGTGAASGGVHGGVAPGARLLVGKVLDDTGFGEDSQVLAGMQWAVAQHADVVSMSLGDSVPGADTDPLSQAVDELSAHSDSLFVIAAGNIGDAPGSVTTPGTAEAAVTVGATDGADAVAYFSSRGPRTGDAAVKPDVSAPGVDIVAARAAGTSLGSPVDEFYTSLSGTSMATPHVAGEAAILKQEHPSWDGEQLKEAIVESTDPAPGATAFDTGTGRVNVETAIGETVLATPSVDLGFYPWPHDGDAPRSAPVIYTNTGSSPVTLRLKLAAPAGVSLSAQKVKVSAGGEATVDLTLDPSQADAGASSGVVTATPVGGGPALRTAFGEELETEHYDLTVTIKPRTGTTGATHQVGIVGLDNGAFDQRTVTGAGTQTLTFRVTPGTYSVGSLTMGAAADGDSEGVLAFNQTVPVSADTPVKLNENTTKRFGYDVPQPVVNSGVNLTVDWAGDDGYSGFTITGSYDRLFAQPLSHPAGGTVDSAINWLLTEPDAQIHPASGPAVPMTVVPVGDAPAWAAKVPAISGDHRIVAGTTGVKNAVALVAGSCGALDSTAAGLHAAGAYAMVVYPNDGASCSGTLASAAPLPVFQARPADVAALLAGGATHAAVTSTRSPSYIYDLAGIWEDSVPNGSTIQGDPAHTSTRIERYDSLGGTTRDGFYASEMMIGWIPERGTAAYGLVRPVAMPSTVTHYLSPGPDWERDFDVLSSLGASLAALYAPPAPVTAGETHRDTWFGGPVSSYMSPLALAKGWDWAPHRDGDTINLYMPQYTDAAGHEGGSLFLDEFDGRVYQDGALIMEGDDPQWLWGDVPPEEHAYRLVYDATRRNDFWQRSTRVLTSWEFTSKHPKAGHETLPLLTVDYDLPLSTTATAPPGTYTFDVRIETPDGVRARPVTKLAVELSWNGGNAWTTVKPQSCAGAGHCTYRVTNPGSGSASLRVTAADSAGRSVRQTVIDAYAVS